MSKVYDPVEWGFLDLIICKLGFADSVVALVGRCISSVSYLFNLNGTVLGNLIPQRGLRQGNPLSPYLFTLCSQSFSAMLTGFAERPCSEGSELLLPVLWCRTCFLQMIVFFSFRQPMVIVYRCRNVSKAMSWPLGSLLIMISLS